MKTSLIEPGQRFSFRLGDVICPDRQQAISQITPELEVIGRIVFLSDCGEELERFAVVEVNGVQSPLVVPVERLQLTVGGREENGRLELCELAGVR